MKTTKISTTLLLLAACFQGLSQTENSDGVSISNNNVPPHENAIFHAMSDLPTPKKGMIIPRMTFEQMLAIEPVDMTTDPMGWPDGLLVYVTSGGYKKCTDIIGSSSQTPGYCWYSSATCALEAELFPCGPEDLPPQFLYGTTNEVVEEYHGLWYWDNSHANQVSSGATDPTPTLKKWRKVGKDEHPWYVNEDGEVYRDDTYVGVGTADPTNPLTIHSTGGTDANLHLTGTGKEWGQNTWRVRMTTPNNSMWATSSTYDFGDGYRPYLGFGMTQHGWYWMNSTGKTSSATTYYPMHLVTNANQDAQLSLNTGTDLYMANGSLTMMDGSGNGVNAYGNVSNSAFEVRAGSDVQIQIGRKNGGANEINNPSYSLDLQFNTGNDVRVGYCNQNGGTPADLYVYGTIFASNTAITKINCPSDETLKENIQDLSNSLETTLQLRGVTFEWIDDEGDQTQYGVIAQEIEAIVPALVSEYSENIYSEDGKTVVTTETHKAVDYNGLIPILIEAIKEQQTIITEMEGRLQALENH